MFYNYAIIVIWLVFLIYWLYKSKGTKTTRYYHPTSSRTIMVIALIVAFLALYGTNTLALQLIPHTIVPQIIGVVIAALGIGFAIWARYTLGANWNARPALKENHELVTNGPYALARHPIYTGIFLAFVGMLIGDGSLRMLIIAILAIIGFAFRIPVEEKLMTDTFPAAYPEYKKRVKAVIPFVL